MKLFMTYAVQHTKGSRILIKIAAQEKFKSWLEKTEVLWTCFLCQDCLFICCIAFIFNVSYLENIKCFYVVSFYVTNKNATSIAL